MMAVQTRVEGPTRKRAFHGLGRGPKIIVIGAVHGNETCGPNAILRAIARLPLGPLVDPPRAGDIRPDGNLKAYSRGREKGIATSTGTCGRKTIPAGLRGQDRQSDLPDAARARRPPRHPLVQRRRRAVHVRRPPRQCGRCGAVPVCQSGRRTRGEARNKHGDPWLARSLWSFSEGARPLGFPTLHVRRGGNDRIYAVLRRLWRHPRMRRARRSEIRRSRLRRNRERPGAPRPD